MCRNIKEIRVVSKQSFTYNVDGTRWPGPRTGLVYFVANWSNLGNVSQDFDDHDWNLLYLELKRCRLEMNTEDARKFSNENNNRFNENKRKLHYNEKRSFSSKNFSKNEEVKKKLKTKLFFDFYVESLEKKNWKHFFEEHQKTCSYQIIYLKKRK